MVYSLRQVGWRKGQPVMTNDIAVTIDAQHLPEDVRRAIARTIQLTLNTAFSANDTDQQRRATGNQP